MLLAGVDIGTLTCRLLIAEVTNAGRLHERRSERRILRLGEGVDRSKALTAAAMQRVSEVLREWRVIVDGAKVDGETAVATSAVREAKNRDQFLSLVKEESGFSVEVISGEEEARRTLLGIRAELLPGVSGILGLDIGGGSTELIVDRPPHTPIVRSIDVGVVRLAERALHHDPPTEDELHDARKLVRTSIEAVRQTLGPIQDLTLLGTAGSVTTLAAMAQQLPAYVSARIHNYRLGLDVIRRLEADILSRRSDQRRGMHGLEAGREGVIAAGVLLLRQAMEVLGHTEVLVSDYGLREGMLIDLAQRMK